MERRPLELGFHLGRIPVIVEPGFWLVSLLIGLSTTLERSALWVAIVFVSVLVHELGHAAVARALGAAPSIRLYSFGGVTHADRALSRGGEIAMALAGPGSGAVLGGLVWAVSHFIESDGELVRFALRQLMWVNLGWGAINLLPVLPLDGGHVLLGVLGAGRQRLALLLGALVAAGIAGIAGWYKEIYIALLFGLLALRNFQLQSVTTKAPFGQVVLDELLARGWRSLSAGDEREAGRLAMLALESAPSAEARNRARDLLAWVALANSNSREALRHLERSEPPEAARALSWAMVFDALDEPDRAVTHALAAHEEEPSETTAALAARLLAHEGRVGEALALVQRHAWARPAARESALAVVESERGAYGDAAVHYRAAFEASGAPRDAIEAARSFARAGANPEAVEMVKRALSAGFAEVDSLVADPELEAVRQDPEIVRLLSEAKPPR